MVQTCWNWSMFYPHPLYGAITHAANWAMPLQWRHNERDGFSNHRRVECLLNRLLRRWSTKTSKLRVTYLWAGNSPVTGEFPTQRAVNADIVSKFHDPIMPFEETIALLLNPCYSQEANSTAENINRCFANGTMRRNWFFFVDEAICQLWWSKKKVDHAESNDTNTIRQCQWQSQVQTMRDKKLLKFLFLIML